jgi:UDP-glucose 4-epimerase
MAKHVVLGADGFIGRHLVKKLAAVEDDEIVAFSRFPSLKLSDDHPFTQHKNVRIVAGDFLNQADVSSCLEKADYVFHLVSSTTPATSNSDPFIDVETNVRSSVELFSLCVDHKVKKVIFLSSGGAVYGDIRDEKISEEMLPQPVSPYGIGKLTIEHYLRYFKRTHGLNYMVYRVANPYGPGQNVHGKQGVIPIFMHKALKNEPITVFGQGDMVRDYIYIDDVVDMIAKTYQLNNHFNEYNLGSSRGIAINELVDLIEECTGKKIKVDHIDTPLTYIKRCVLDTSRFASEFTLQPKTILQEGFARTWDYVKELG